MGLFSRAPKIPEPHVTRTLTISQIVYHPGSRVAGNLTLQCPTQRQIVRVEASFHGTASTHLWRSESSGSGDSRTTRNIDYKDDADLFRHTQLLDKSFNAQPGQTFSWPFDFAFPFETTNSRGEVYRKETACSPSYQVLPHDLPPSFDYELSHSTFARVKYNVEAILHFADAEEPMIVKFEDFNFSPLPLAYPIQAPFVEHVRDVEKYASSRLTGREKSFRLSIRDKFSSATPSLDVSMKASVLPVVTTGSTFSLFVCAELSNLSDPYSISVPNVQLRIKSLKLRKTATFRAIRADGWSSWPEMEETHNESLILNALPEVRTAEMQVGDRKQLVFPAAFEARLPGDCAPCFSTVNINYSCGLKIVVEAEVCGRCLSISSKWRRIRCCLPERGARSHQCDWSQKPNPTP